jgi:hypothetical protein
MDVGRVEKRRKAPHSTTLREVECQMAGWMGLGALKFYWHSAAGTE